MEMKQKKTWRRVPDSFPTKPGNYLHFYSPYDKFLDHLHLSIYNPQSKNNNNNPQIKQVNNEFGFFFNVFKDTYKHLKEKKN